MAREFGKVFTNIWADNDFRALTSNAQRMYFQLISQPDLSMAGVVTLAAKRWSLQVDDQDVSDIECALDELGTARFVLTDESTQEALIRSHIRRDGGWKSPTTMKGIESSCRAVLSDYLKSTIRAELARIDTSRLSATESEKTGRSTRDVVEGLIRGILDDFPPHQIPQPIPHSKGYTTPLPMGTNGNLHETETETEPETETETEPETEMRKSGATAGSASVDARKRARYPDEFERFWSEYPIRRDKGKALNAWKRATQRAANDEIIAGAVRYRNDPNRLDQFTKYAEGWLNGNGWEDDPLPERNQQQVAPSRAQQRWNNNYGVVQALGNVQGELA